VDTELLRSFIAVTDHGGFSAAARALNRTQSAVSLQIKRLEERLGVAVFARSSRKVALTEAGGRYLPYARHLLALQEEALSAAKTSQTRPIRVGLSDEQAEAYLPKVLPAFTERFPSVPVEVSCAMSPSLVDMVESGRLDLALAVRHQPAPTGAVIGDEPLVWAASCDLTLGAADAVPLIVNPEGCVYRAQALALLAAGGRRWRIAYTSQSPTGINIAVRLGMGVTVKAARSVPEGCRVLGDREGLPDLTPAQVELHRAPVNFSAAADALAELLTDAVRDGTADHIPG
jgi:DNA-binding transcriptional LysR family regulator